MSDSDQKIQLTVQVNAETGELEVLGAKFNQTSNKAKEASYSFGNLGKEAKNLVDSFLPFATGAGIISFFTKAVMGAEEQNEAIRRLRNTLESNGQSWEKNQEKVESWINAISVATRFSDGDAVNALDKFTRVTGSLGQAQAATKLAMDLSVASGRELGDTVNLVTDLLNGNERALLQVKKEFANVAGGAKDTQEAIDKLSVAYGGAAENSKGLTDETAKLKNSFSQLSDTVGNALAPSLSFLSEGLKTIIEGYQKLGIVIGGVGAMATATSLSGIKAAFGGMIDEINAFETKITDTTVLKTQERLAITEAAHQKDSEELDKKNQERLIKLQEQSQKEADLETQKFQFMAQQRQESNATLEQLEMSLQQKISQMGKDVFSEKQALLNAEIAAKIQSVKRNIAVEADRQKALKAIREYEAKATADLEKEKLLLKRMAALETADVALQTFSVINSMMEKDSESQVNRAKGILALEKAIAIARILSSPQAALNPGLAAAQIALTVAQFAQQFKAIDDSREAFKQSKVSFATNEVSLGLGGGTFTEIGGGGQSGGPIVIGPGGGGGGMSTSGGGGGGGFGGGVINVGGITLNMDIDKLAIDNVKEVMDRIREAVRRGTIEGVQLAVTLKNAADRNANMAV